MTINFRGIWDTTENRSTVTDLLAYSFRNNVFNTVIATLLFKFRQNTIAFNLCLI